MASNADVFPLDPYYTYPIEEDAIDRKVRLRMASGKQYIRSQGTDLRVWELGGRCSSAERKTLLDFYELHAVCGCTFSDRDYSPAEDHVVVFQKCPTVTRVGFEDFVWKCMLEETTVA